MIHIYTDGSSHGNPGPGGYGVILEHGSYKKELSGGFEYTTNNRMELMAVIIGLEALKSPQKVHVYSDSRYVVHAIENRWLQGWVQKNFKNKKNQDLWQRYLQVAKHHQVSFSWIKGHAGHPDNERCDALASQAAKQTGLPKDTGYENFTKTLV